jgi:4-amino-4-deoxy-L-arabinose transferase-like glycosyltransferase
MNPRLRFAGYGALLACLLFFAWIRIKERAMPLERDEGEYAYMGQLLRQGIPPYKFASNMKLPGTYAAYAAIMAVFGESASGIHLGMILVTSACALLIFLLGKYLSSPLAGTVAACAYLLLAIRPAVLGIVAHATHFVVLAALAGILLLLHAIDRKRTSLFFASGLLFGIAFLMKQPGIFFAVFGGCYWLWGEVKTGFSPRNIAVRAAALVAGVVLPYALTCLWLLHAGVFPNFWFWTWIYARQYGSMVTWSQAWNDSLKLILPWVLRPFAFWELAALGLTAPLWSRHARARGGFLAGFFLTSCLAVLPGLYFRPHYFILILPAGALCIGVALECAQRELRERELGEGWSARLALLPVLYFAIVYVLAVRGLWRDSFHLDPNTLNDKIYAAGFVQSVDVANFIQSRSAPQDEIGILGSEPEICFYSGLRCASSFLYVYPLMERQPFAASMQEQMKRELQAERPRFLVVVDNWTSWNWAPTIEQNRPFLDWAWDFAHHGYDLVDQVTIPAGSDVPSLWGDRPRFYVFQRQD